MKNPIYKYENPDNLVRQRGSGKILNIEKYVHHRQKHEAEDDEPHPR